MTKKKDKKLKYKGKRSKEEDERYARRTKKQLSNSKC